jgi:hypothetical protein
MNQYNNNSILIGGLMKTFKKSNIAMTVSLLASMSVGSAFGMDMEKVQLYATLGRKIFSLPVIVPALLAKPYASEGIKKNILEPLTKDSYGSASIPSLAIYYGLYRLGKYGYNKMFGKNPETSPAVKQEELLASLRTQSESVVTAMNKNEAVNLGEMKATFAQLNQDVQDTLQPSMDDFCAAVEEVKTAHRKPAALKTLAEKKDGFVRAMNDVADGSRMHVQPEVNKKSAAAKKPACVSCNKQKSSAKQPVCTTCPKKRRG